MRFNRTETKQTTTYYNLKYKNYVEMINTINAYNVKYKTTMLQKINKVKCRKRRRLYCNLQRYVEAKKKWQNALNSIRLLNGQQGGDSIELE